jgi:hypothetical protein
MTFRNRQHRTDEQKYTEIHNAKLKTEDEPPGEWRDNRRLTENAHIYAKW